MTLINIPIINNYYSLFPLLDQCPYTKVKQFSRDDEHVMSIDTAYSTKWKIFDQDQGKFALNNTEICSISPTLGERGVYNLVIEENGNCSYSTIQEPNNRHLALLLPLLILIVFICVQLFRQWYKKRNEISTESEEEPIPTMNTLPAGQQSNESSPSIKKAPPSRLKSLDTFRGISITLMIFVNSGGGHYSYIEHATWNGLHIADLVFPFFLWIMGVCIPISVKSQLGKNVPKKEMILNVLRVRKICF